MPYLPTPWYRWLNTPQNGESFRNLAKSVKFWQKNSLIKEATNQKRNRVFTAIPELDVTQPKPAQPTS